MMRKLVPAAITIAVVAITAAAANAMTISLGQPTLIGRVAISEPVTVSCSPFDASLTLTGESINMNVEQAAGREIARGSGYAFSFAPTSLFACDGSQTTIPISVQADPAGPPFHGGPAVITASAGAGAATPCWPGSTTCFTDPAASQSATAGPTSLNLN